MLKLSNVKLAERCDSENLKEISSALLGISLQDVLEVDILKLSIDARRKTEVSFVYTLLVTVADEAAVLTPEGSPAKSARVANAANTGNVAVYHKPEPYAFPAVSIGDFKSEKPPVIVGTGPAGLFSALCLAEAGVKCIILERGKPVEQRIKSVSHFWETGEFDTESNVQFGEGGAGTFSDGKLTTGINDTRIRFVLEQLVKHGAPEDIMYLAKPHIGTDRLRSVVIAIRTRLLELGCDIRFGHKLEDVTVIGGKLERISVDNGSVSYSIETSRLILAPGNSARDTFEMLNLRGFSLSPKSFSVGVRIEHLQRDIDLNQYGTQAMESGISYPASDYKLAVHLENGRSVYTFCVCPGGEIVAAASETGRVVTNGMSYYSRDGENINGALLVSVTPDDFGNAPLGGIEFQRELEARAFIAGGNNYFAPAQLVGDFLKKQASLEHKKITPTYRPGVTYCNLWDVLPEFVCQALFDALPELAKKVRAFADPYAVMTAVETRSSSPVRIDRENYETVGIKGIYPCGEGAGYAGGIMSAAVDGIRCAEAMFSNS